MIFMCDNIWCLNEWVVIGGGVDGVVGDVDGYDVMCDVVCDVVCDVLMFSGFGHWLTDWPTD